jgi:ribonuclease BN (tRNA processing enzyme)
MTRLVLLGTAAGSVYTPDQVRRGSASAVVVGDAVYLVDCGEGVATRYRQAGLGPATFQHGIDHLRAIFFTHLHSDHTVGYPGLLVAGVLNGLSYVTRPIRVYGPGRRASTEATVAGRPADRVVNPQNPMPGTVDLTRGILSAYATDLNERLRSPSAANPEHVFEAHDIQLPAGTDDDPIGVPSPAMEPFVVYQDENVRVLATLVDHGPCFPAFGFRFETPDGVIVFSGDTRPSDNLVRMASGADILVHEAVSRPAMERLFMEPEARPRLDTIIGQHTTIEQVDRIAAVAQVQKLVLSPLLPPNAPDEEFVTARPEFTGPAIVGQDLAQITLR